jgi:hypothetical protein
MCKGCTYEGCPGCGWICNCEKRCFKCSEAATHAGEELHDFRSKYVCFDCFFVWKNKHTKYRYYNSDRDLKFLQVYYNTKVSMDNISKCNNSREDDISSRCPKCAKLGTLVGRNFRPCKNKKEWSKLKKKFLEGSIDMVEDFTYYPREANNPEKYPYDA